METSEAKSDPNPFTPPQPEASSRQVRSGVGVTLRNSLVVLAVFFGLTYGIGVLGGELPPNRAAFFALLPVFPAALLLLILAPSVNPFVVGAVIYGVIGLAILSAMMRKPERFPQALFVAIVLGVVNGVLCMIAWFVLRNTFAT